MTVPYQVTIRDREPVARKMRKAYNTASQEAWAETGVEFHRELMPARFTHSHATKAGYTPRQGERGSGDPFRGSYTAQKLRKYGHTRPLEKTGETRRSVERHFRVTSSSKGARVVYPGARKFNFRSRGSDVRMAREFRTLIPIEARRLGASYDRRLDRNLKTPRAGQ